MPVLTALKRASLTLAVLGNALALAAEPGAGEPAAAEPAAAASAPAGAASAPANGITVTEDKYVRIEQTRVRGQVQRVVVHSKLRGVKPYEILLDPGRDPALGRGVDGQRAWSVFDF
ncbi:MAG: hypothetical protein KGI90_02020 [Burkholderiales bacterium]|nr:hypothetical protein [Burkholderiales bacterium]